MNCEQMNDLLWAFLDGELTAQEEEQMHAHLEQCADCRALLEQLQTLRTSFSDLEEIPAPEGFAEGVMNRIKAESKPKVIPLFKRPQIRALTAMAACAVLFVGLGSIRMGSSKGEAAPMAPAPSAAVYDAAPAAVIAGHVHFDHEDVLPNGVPQYITDVACDGHCRVVTLFPA